MHGGRSVFSLLVSAVMGFALISPASAQVYPPPTPTPTSTPEVTPTPTPRFHACATTGSIKKKGKGKNKSTSFEAKTTFIRNEKIAVKGGRGCAKKNARVRVSIDVDGEATKIGAADSNKKGAYLVSGRIPSDASFGSHAIFVTSGKRTYVTDIVVTPASGARDTGASSAGPMLAAWVALAGMLAAYLVSSRRRRRQPVVMLAASSEVPLIDTSHFVPTLPKRRRTAAKRPAAKKGPAAKKPTAKKPAARKPAVRKPDRSKAADAKAKGASVRKKGVAPRKPAAKQGPSASVKKAKKATPAKPPTRKRKPPKS